jgi:hypothetical protein
MGEEPLALSRCPPHPAATQAPRQPLLITHMQSFFTKEGTLLCQPVALPFTNSLRIIYQPLARRQSPRQTDSQVFKQRFKQQWLRTPTWLFSRMAMTRRGTAAAVALSVCTNCTGALLSFLTPAPNQHAHCNDKASFPAFELTISRVRQFAQMERGYRDT